MTVKVIENNVAVVFYRQAGMKGCRLPHFAMAQKQVDEDWFPGSIFATLLKNNALWISNVTTTTQGVEKVLSTSKIN